MKKRLLGVLALVFCMGIASCDEEVPPEPEPDIGDGLDHSTQALLNPTLVALNAENYDELDDPIFPTKIGEETFYIGDYSYYSSGYRIVDSSYASYGLLVVRNYYNRVGFYSLLHQDFIIEPQLVPEWIAEQNVYQVDRIGFLLTFRYDNVYRVYDGFGNELYKNSIYPSLNNQYNTHTEIVNEIVYLNIGDTYYFQYAEDGSATQVDYIPEPQPVIIDDYYGPELNDLYKVGWVDLTLFGYPNYSIAYNESGLCTVFNGTTQLSTFYIDLNQYNILGIFSQGRILFQGKTLLPDIAEEYDYSVGNNKYSLSTLVVNINNGQKTELDYRVVFNKFSMIQLNATSIGYVAKYQEITKEKVLASQVSVIVDNNLVFHDDISGIEFDNFVNLKNAQGQARFYNETTNVLYDQNFKVITHLRPMSPYYSQRMNAFIGNYDGLYGVVDLDGKVIAEFRYSSIKEASFYQNSVLANKGTELYRIELDNGHEEKLGTNYFEHGKNFVSYVDTFNSKHYYSLNHTTLFEISADYIQSMNTRNYLDGNYVYFVSARSNYSSDYITYYSVRYTDFVPHAISDDVKGEEVESYTNNGTYDEPYNLVSGVNTLHYTSASYSSSDRFYIHIPSDQYTAIAINTDYVRLSSTSYVVGTPRSLDNGETLYVFSKPTDKDGYKVELYRYVSYYENRSQTAQVTAFINDGYFAKAIVNPDGSTGIAGLNYSNYLNWWDGLTFTCELTSNGDYNYKPVFSGVSVSEYRIGTKTYSTDSEADGFNALSGTVVTFEFTVDGYQSGTPIGISFTKSTIQVTPGYTRATAKSFAYGSNDPINFPGDTTYNTIYLKFESKHGGTYSFSFSFTSNFSNREYTQYVDGYAYDEYSYSISSSYYNLNNYVMMPDSYIVFGFTMPAQASVNATCTVSSDAGYSYENPFTMDSYNKVLNSSYKFVRYTELLSEPQTYILNVDPLPQTFGVIKNNVLTLISTYDSELTVDGSVVFYNPSAAQIVISLLQKIEENITALETGHSYDLGSVVEHWRFTNTGDSTIMIRIELTIYNSAFIEAVKSIGFKTQSEYSSFNRAYSLLPGECVSVTTLGSSDGSHITVNLEDKGYIVNTSSYAYNWEEYEQGYYHSTNSGINNSTSSMSVTFTKAGVFNFYYKSSGESSCDYLIVYKNGEELFDCYSNYNMSNFELSTNYDVVAGDVIEFVFKKDGSSHYYDDRAYVGDFFLSTY